MAHIVIEKDFVSELGLRGNELLVFSMVYGYSQNQQGCFYGSINFIADWLGITRPTVINTLQSLVEKKIVDKKEYVFNGVKRCEYSVSASVAEGSKNILPPQSNFFTSGSKEILPNTISNNKDINNTQSSVRVCEEKKLFGETVRLTDKEYSRLVEDYGEEDAKRLVAILDNYRINYPRKAQYKSDYRAILSWCVQKLNEEKTAELRLRRAQNGGSNQPDMSRNYQLLHEAQMAAAMAMQDVDQQIYEEEMLLNES